MIDRTKVSFAEAEGKAKFPSVLRWGQSDQRLVAGLWNAFYFFLDENIWEDIREDDSYNDLLFGILLREHVHRRHRFVNEFERNFRVKSAEIERWSQFFREADIIDLLDFVTFIIRDHECPAKLVDHFEAALNKPWSPYRIIRSENSVPTIFPVVSSEEAKAIQADINIVFESRFEGAKTHLQASLDALGREDHRGTVREAINAVESAVRDFTGDDSAVLSKALKSLRSEDKLHPALAEAFDKLYAYSSDEKGVRHALVFKDNEKVGFAEAVFFVSACSAFVGFLSRANSE